MLKFLSLIMYQIRNGKLDNTILNDSKIFLGISPNFSINNFNPSTHQLRVLVAANYSTLLSVSINGGKNSAEVANFKDDACVHCNGIRGFYSELEFKIRPNDLRIEENKITLRASKTE
ncbi:hypothetical protein H8356DRAFT_1306710 [Neocallimastix lanati (nom. inval.)]|nr:hypothetical protein H8356DRAFT_1306710 [Neocallimastix sp. JGI-2020a]